MTIGVVGLGLIGGSMAKDLQAAGHHILGYDANPIHVDQAMDFGIIEKSLELEELAKTAEIIIVAVPVKYTASTILELLNLISWQTVIMDAASTKATICAAVKSHTKRGRFVACHPLAGTEFSGPKAAILGLYKNKKNIICDEHVTDEDALDIAISVLTDLGMQNIFMDPEQHDKHMAYVSHLSHVSAFSLSSTVLNIEKDQKQIFNLASTGFASTVRLAKSNPHTWSSIFADNSDHLLTALDSYIEELQKMRIVIASKDEEKLMDKIADSNNIKRVLNGMKHNIVKLS